MEFIEKSLKKLKEKANLPTLYRLQGYCLGKGYHFYMYNHCTNNDYLINHIRISDNNTTFLICHFYCLFGNRLVIIVFHINLISCLFLNYTIDYSWLVISCQHISDIFLKNFIIKSLNLINQKFKFNNQS